MWSRGAGGNGHLLALRNDWGLQGIWAGLALLMMGRALTSACASEWTLGR